MTPGDTYGLITRESVHAVRERARIDEVVGEHVTLKNAGLGALKGLCPFHDEKTPSFNVRPAVGRYHCFGCGEDGDVISFVQKMTHMSFIETVEYLAGRYGVQLHYDDSHKGSARSPRSDFGTRQRLYAIQEVAEEFYREQLMGTDAVPAQRFLGDRGFTPETAATFSVGYAPQGWDSLARHLRGRGFTEKEMADAGVVSAGQRGAYDRFRGRLIWPIRDVTGKTIGFGARRLYDDDQGPKYLNTPETAIYKKSQVLYGLDLARKAIAAKRQVVVVEGYTDVMAAHEAGIDTAVASCGTAFGAEHVTIVRRIMGDSSAMAAMSIAAEPTSALKGAGGEVIFTFDGDEAGQKAALKAFSEDQRFVAQTFVAVDPQGMDPCDVRLHRGDAALREVIDHRVPMFEFAIRSALQQVNLHTAEGQVTGLRMAAPVVAQIRDHALRPEYARRLSGWLGLDERTVMRAVQDASRAASENHRSVRNDRRSHINGEPHTSNQPGGSNSYDDNGGVLRPLTLRDILSGNDPVVRVEVQALATLIQAPHKFSPDAVGLLPDDVFRTPALQSVWDCVLATAMLDEVAQGRASVQQFVDSVLEIAAETVRPLIAELASVPLPVRTDEQLTALAESLLVRLTELSLTHEHSELRRSLGMLDPSSEDYMAALQRIAEIQTQRRALKPEM